MVGHAEYWKSFYTLELQLQGNRLDKLRSFNVYILFFLLSYLDVTGSTGARGTATPSRPGLVLTSSSFEIENSIYGILL